jgi:hypothetical protein
VIACFNGAKGPSRYLVLSAVTLPTETSRLAGRVPSADNRYLRFSVLELLPACPPGVTQRGPSRSVFYCPIDYKSTLPASISGLRSLYEFPG